MSKLADALFSKTQQQVLGLLYGNPKKSFFINEILRTTGMGVATIKRELDRLQEAGILLRTKVGNQHHYQPNPECPVYHELLALVQRTCRHQVPSERLGTSGLAATGAFVYPPASFSGQAGRVNETEPAFTTPLVSAPELELITRRYHIRRLSLFGSAARGELAPDSDIDLLVEFEPGAAPTLGGMTRLNAEFSRLFGGRKVDLATQAIMHNPYRRRAIEKDLKVLYAAR